MGNPNEYAGLIALDDAVDTLDLGCGRAKAPGAFGVDLDPRSGADLTADLNRPPLPLPDGRFSRIVCRHVVEHVDDVTALFDEIHRLSRPGARIEITTPHFSSRFSYTDPTHRHHLGVQFIDFYADRPGRGQMPGRLDVAANWLFEYRFSYAPLAEPPKFRLVSQRITFARVFRLLGVQRLMNRCFRFWETKLAYLIPARDLEYVLEARK